MFDIIIRNGTVVDGTGKPGFVADVGIKQKKVAKVGKIWWTRGRHEIDASGKVVAPGFVDIHNHSDSHWRIFLDPQLPSLVSQGVTTIVGGNCGASIAPLTSGKIIEAIQKWIDVRQINVNWLSMLEFREEMSKRKFALNFATLVGHGTLRRGVIGDEMRKLNEGELDFMRNMLVRSLLSGAIGVSAGLAYSHERDATWDELKSLAILAKQQEKIFSIHLRNEGSEIISALDEALDLAKQTGVSMQISHFKVMGEKNWKLADAALEKIEEAQKAGADVNFDVYPYTETGSVLYVYLPPWAAEGGKEMLLRRLKEKHLRKKIIEGMREGKEYHYENAIIASSLHAKNPAERNIAKIAEARGVSAEEVIADLLLASDGRVLTLLDCLSGDNVRKNIIHPLSIVASDGSGYDVNSASSGELVHPRCFGTFPRVLGKYVRDEKLLTLEEAVKKMTAMPAKKAGLKDRGILQKNYKADIVVFNPETIRDLATIENPFQYSEGVSEVVVNGKMVLDQGKMTGEMGGEFISS